MSMRKKSKAVSWKRDGRRGRKLAKKLANRYERREGKKEIKNGKSIDCWMWRSCKCSCTQMLSEQ